MIKYPNGNGKNLRVDNSLKSAVNAGDVRVGQRFFIGDNPVTCVHIDGNKYIFSMDDIFKMAPHDKIEKVFEIIYRTGMIDDLNVIPTDIMLDIDFLFVPTERQVFGKNEYGIKESDEQFEWFKNRDASKIKNYKGVKSYTYSDGETCSWWLSTISSCNSGNCCYVNYNGNSSRASASATPTTIGVPVFFQMTREEN